LESAISATNNLEEKKVYMELHTKLSQQLLELVEVEVLLPNELKFNSPN
jgi:hypothetical protein